VKKGVEKPIFFLNSEKEKLWGVLSLPKRKGKVPAILLIPGFNGSKSARKFVKLGRILAQNDLASLRFDFSGCGDSEGEFKNLCLGQEVKDLKSAYQFLIKQPNIDKKRVGFLGHSLGALIACLFQKKNPVAKTLILVAPALDQKSLMKIWYTLREIKEWRKKGYLDTPKGRIGIQYFNEAKDYTPIVSQIKISTLIIQGKRDEDVPLKFSKKIIKFLKGRKKLTIIEEADHDFESYQSFNKLARHSLAWFKKYL